MNAYEAMDAGLEILDPFLNSHGFVFVAGTSGPSSGGLFASGEYRKGDRRLELHFRHGLGLVAYHLGAVSLTHEEYMWSLLGPGGANRYPGFSDDPLDGFRHLRHDLENFCDDFLSGAGDVFKQCAEKAQQKIKGFGALWQ